MEANGGFDVTCGSGDVPIIDKDKTLLGIVTEHDLLNAFVEGKDVKDITAGDIMTKDPISVSSIPFRTSVRYPPRVILTKTVFSERV